MTKLDRVSAFEGLTTRQAASHNPYRASLKIKVKYIAGCMT